MKLLGLGDNTADQYLSHKRMYPGGNAVNVAVFAKRLGADASYLGALGDDKRGELIESALTAEGVEHSRIQRVAAPTAWTRVAHEHGDRRFVASNPGARQFLRLGDDDYAYIAAHDLVHSSIYSFMDEALPAVRASAPVLSWDFYNRWSETYLAAMVPLVDWAFISVPDAHDDAVNDLLDRCRAWGAKNVIVTRGSAPAWLDLGGERWPQPSQPIVPVDTIGAGDAFIATLLVLTHDGRTGPRAAGLEAARNAATACLHEGSFGHGVDWNPFIEP